MKQRRVVGQIILRYYLPMANPADKRRRTLGIIFLASALLMLALGLTVLKNRFTPEAFICYWLVCMVFTALTMLVALLDMRAVRLRSRAEKAELAKTVLKEFVSDDSEA